MNDGCMASINYSVIRIDDVIERNENEHEEKTNHTKNIEMTLEFLLKLSGYAGLYILNPMRSTGIVFLGRKSNIN